MHFNNVVLIGRLTADPKTRPAGESTVATFRLAVTRRGRRDEADFVSVECWNTLAESVAQYLRKGRLVGVVGELRSGEWTSPDGERRSRLDVLAHSVDFLDLSRPAAAGGTGEEVISNTSSADGLAGSVASVAG